MSQPVFLRRFRPYLFTSYRRLRSPPSPSRRAFASSIACSSERDVTKDYKKRVAQLEAYKPAEEWYPRLRVDADERWPIQTFKEELDFLEKDETLDDGETFTVAGRITSIRTAGSKLLFMDLKQSDHTLQIVCAYKRLSSSSNDAETILSELKGLAKLARKGDWYEATGYAHRTSSGELSLLATNLPNLLSPSLHQIPERLYDDETRARGRHVEMLVPHSKAIQTLRVRHLVEQHLNNFLTDDGFTKVSTPILTSGAGGAVARPFETQATELEGQTLNLRIAPELWLKRLVVGGMEKVYEIGPAFRNEGVDATHNPEFSTCEFYEAFATLEDLMAKTENLLRSMKVAIASHREELGDLWKEESAFATMPGDIDFASPFQRLEFLPTIASALGPAHSLPDLSDPETATPALLTLFAEKNLALPSNPTLPRLLDALAAAYIEPLCSTPTFITHHPTALSPLSKTFPCPTTGQPVAARAELFIAGTEYANMYEEENSPFAQRAKFEAQLAFRRVDGEGDGKGGLDEDFLRCLEWGLPPTGGWGCGVERLVMLFAGRERMGDVLPFGSLRNVVGLGRG